MHKNSKPFNILKYVLICGGVIVIGSFLPMFGTGLFNNLIRFYFKNKKFRREYFLQDLKRLQDRKLISYQKLTDGKIKIVLTKLGKQKIITNDIEHMKLKSKKWDKKWRLVIFDIPEKQKSAREALRLKLRELLFYSIQKSVYLTPYPCEEEIDFICTTYDLDRNNVLLMEVNKFEGSDKLKAHFGL